LGVAIAIPLLDAAMAIRTDLPDEVHLALAAGLSAHLVEPAGAPDRAQGRRFEAIGPA
jgi:hypothetical protein